MKIELVGTISPKITLSDIEVTEKEINVKFPKEYITFMLSQNGGYPKKSKFSLPDKSNSTVISHFYSIGDMKSNLKKVNWMLEGVIPLDYISIGNDPGGNEILLRVKGENIGEIYFWDHDVNPEEEDPMHFLAKSLNDFLKMLEQPKRL